VFWGISGVLARRHAASFFAEHESHIQQGTKRDSVLAELEQEKRSLFRELAKIRFLAAFLAIGTLSVTVGLLWRRRVSRPMTLISNRIDEMKRGTWTRPIPLNQDDEMGTLIRELNELGPNLTFTAHQYAAASKLAAMALVGQRVVRRTTAARQRLLAVSEALERLPGDEQFQGVVDQVRQVAGELESVAADFDSEFQAELARVSSSPKTTGDDGTA
jgi:methyl-accepting chemotaxis protein